MELNMSTTEELAKSFTMAYDELMLARRLRDEKLFESAAFHATKAALILDTLMFAGGMINEHSDGKEDYLEVLEKFQSAANDLAKDCSEHL